MCRGTRVWGRGGSRSSLGTRPGMAARDECPLARQQSLLPGQLIGADGAWRPGLPRRAVCRTLGAEASRTAGGLPRTSSLPTQSLHAAAMALRAQELPRVLGAGWPPRGADGRAWTSRQGPGSRTSSAAPALPPGGTCSSLRGSRLTGRMGRHGSPPGPCEGWTAARALGEAPAAEKHVPPSAHPGVPGRPGPGPPTGARLSASPWSHHQPAPTAPQRSVCLTQGCVPEGTLPRPPPPGAGTHLGGRQVPRRGTHTAGLGPGLVSGEGREDFQEERQQEAWRKGVGAPCQGGTGRPRVRTAASTRRPPDAHRGGHRSREPRET